MKKTKVEVETKQVSEQVNANTTEAIQSKPVKEELRLVGDDKEVEKLRRKVNKFFKIQMAEPVYIINMGKSLDDGKVHTEKQEKRAKTKYVVCKIHAYISTRSMKGRHSNSIDAMFAHATEIAFMDIVDKHDIYDMHVTGTAACAGDDEFSVNYGMRLAENRAKAALFNKIANLFKRILKVSAEHFLCVQMAYKNYKDTATVHQELVDKIVKEGPSEDDKYADSIAEEKADSEAETIDPEEVKD